MQQVLFSAPSDGTDAVSIAKAGLDALIEPVKTRDMPRFFLNRQDAVLHHCQIVEGDVAMKIRKLLTMNDIGHF